MIDVVAAILIEDGKLMLAQRPAGKHMGLRWEFPGGKVEKGETPEAALERELKEELNIETKTGALYTEKLHRYPEKEIRLMFYFTSLIGGTPQPIEEAQVGFFTMEEAERLDLADADRLLFEQLLRDITDKKVYNLA